MDRLHLAFARRGVGTQINGHPLAPDAAVCVPDLRVTEEQQALRQGVVVGLLGARVAITIVELEVAGLPDLLQRLRASLEDRVQAVGQALL